MAARADWSPVELFPSRSGKNGPLNMTYFRKHTLVCPRYLSKYDRQRCDR